jgi:Conjugative transposon protein TcpC
MSRSGQRRHAQLAATPAVLLVGVGRLVLWLLLGFLLVRGAADVLASGERNSRSSAAPAAAAAWPDDGARAFAVDFARAYLSYSPRRPGRYARELAPFVSTEVAGSVVPRFARRGPRQAVQTAAVARALAIDGTHALVTVAASVVSGGVSTRYLTVPVARDAGGGLAVYDLPSLSAPPTRAQPAADETESLPAGEEGEIGDVLQRFFAAFLAGRAGDLEYFVPAGGRLGALAQRYELAGVASVAQVGPGSARARTVLVGVRARDARTRAVYALRYRVALVRRDRWYVAAINSPKEG